jgi:hypothetical protein
MGLLQYLSKVYRPETLDTRFVIPANAPPRDALAERSSSRLPASTAKIADVQPSLWKTPEFFFYYLVFIIVVPIMFKSPMDLSQRKLPASQQKRSSTDAM